ncbi:MAG: hypothetical protein IIA08_04615 [Proteobacteria bacterium]|nr:hypothetical protein [Pseudomonadota bacterium]
MHALKALFLMLLIGTLAWNQPSSAEILPANANGWHTWQVDEVGPVARMCCFSWRRGAPRQADCDLNVRNISLANESNCASEPGVVQIYARMKNGVPVDIRVLSSACPVSAEGTITDHGLVSVAENIYWFRRVIENPRLDMDVREEALFGLVQSESDAVFEYFDALLAKR